MFIHIKAKNQLFLTEFIVRFCTWSLLSQLLIHLTNMHWGNEPQKLYLIGASLSLLYINAICGGLTSDWLTCGKQTIIVGVGLIAAGNLLLVFNQPNLYLGLVLVLLGAGMVTPNIPLSLSSLKSKDTAQDNAFTILYGVTNAGVILGSIIGGMISILFSWNSILFLNEAMLGFLLINLLSHRIAGMNKLYLRNILVLMILLPVYAYFASYFLHFKSVSYFTMVLAGEFYIGFLIFLMTKIKSFRKKLIFSLFLTLLAIMFFCAEFQITSMLVLYAQNFVSLKVLNVNFPAGSILALESMFVVIGSFALARLKFFTRETNILTKIGTGFIFGTISFTTLYISALVAAYHSISLIWLLLAFLFLGLGEVYLMPPIMAYIAHSAPTEYKGRFMAGKYYSLGLSGYLSGILGSTMSKNFVSASNNLLFYLASFKLLIILLATTAILVFIARFMCPKDCLES